jgi:hypothetical protein
MACVSHAAPIRGGAATYEYFNSFVTRLFPGTPFNPGTEAVDLVVESDGIFRQVWQDQVGDTIQDELTSVRQSGALPGDPPIPFEILAGTLETPELGPFVGSLTSIVQDTGDPGFATGAPSSLSSAFRRVAGPFAQVLIDGTFLYTVDDYAFETTVTQLPFPVGAEFVGTADSNLEIRVRLGPTIDPANDPVVAMALAGGIVRITGIVPEPTTSLLLAMGTCFFMFRVRPRRV